MCVLRFQLIPWSKLCGRERGGEARAGVLGGVVAGGVARQPHTAPGWRTCLSLSSLSTRFLQVSVLMSPSEWEDRGAQDSPVCGVVLLLAGGGCWWLTVLVAGGGWWLLTAGSRPPTLGAPQPAVRGVQPGRQHTAGPSLPSVNTPHLTSPHLTPIS